VKGFDSAADALRELLSANPRVIAFGEYHETKGAAAVDSSIARFTAQLLDVVRDGASDLIVETWVRTGDCGEQETKVVEEVQTTTRRPETTESEVVTLIKRAKAAGLQPHILELDCKQYRSILGQDGEVDYMKLLEVITRGLRDKITLLLKRGGPDGKRVLVYGGALHNDVFPRKELAAYTFAPPVTKAARGRYLEVDLFVPEYLEKDELLAKEKWFATWREHAKDAKVLMIRRGPSSAMIFFPRGAIKAPAPGSPPGSTPAAPPSRPGSKTTPPSRDAGAPAPQPPR
jgi:hypothetical protein